MVLESRAQVLERARSWFATIPDGVSLADEFIAERREEIGEESLK